LYQLLYKTHVLLPFIAQGDLSDGFGSCGIDASGSETEVTSTWYWKYINQTRKESARRMTNKGNLFAVGGGIVAYLIAAGIFALLPLFPVRPVVSMVVAVLMLIS